MSRVVVRIDENKKLFKSLLLSGEDKVVLTATKDDTGRVFDTSTEQGLFDLTGVLDALSLSQISYKKEAVV